MKIQTGLFDHMVLQRNGRNQSEAAVTGTAAGAGRLTATVRRGGQALKGLKACDLGPVRGGKFSVKLCGIPTGGPYDIELQVTAGGKATDKLTVHDVLVGDVWLLGGQSNMQGVGDKADSVKSDPLVRNFNMNDTWSVARDPLHDLSISVDPVHTDLCGGTRPGLPGRYCVGPGLPFGVKMKQLLGVPQGLIACAHGGTSMAQWDPALKAQGGKSLYGAMVRRFKHNGSRVRGLVWYQGCSDANPDTVPLYTERMKKLVAACRRDCADPKLPVVLVQIARVVNWWSGESCWNAIQDQQRRLPRVIRNCLTVPAIDLPLDDLIHVSGSGMVVLGRRLAQAMDVLIRGAKGGKPPIEVGSVSIEPDPDHGTANVVVEFQNVVQGLVALDRPAGFTLVAPQGRGQIYDVKLRGASAVLRTTQGAAALADMQLHYGYGTDPYCNIVDVDDRSLPVFGPVPLGKPRATTPCVRDLRVSPFQPGAGKLEKLGFPSDLAGLKFEPRTFAENFCSLHTEIVAAGQGDRVVYYACAFECAEPMKLALLLGYDGPVKAWIDGRELYRDPAGTNPAVCDAHPVRFNATAGRHEVVVALGTNGGAAWGIFLRFERLDVSPAQLRKGPGTYPMPIPKG